jgi:hypothetical protein
MRFSTAKDVQNLMRMRFERKKESFHRVLDQCYGKIEKAAKHDLTWCVFDVPEFMLGYPIYDLNECIQYVYHHLTHKGFRVDYFFPKMLCVIWTRPTPAALGYAAGGGGGGGATAGAGRRATAGAAAGGWTGGGGGRRTGAAAAAAASQAAPRLLTVTAPAAAAAPARARAKSQAAVPVAAAGQVHGAGTGTSPTFFKSISEFKPSGKFVLNLT